MAACLCAVIDSSTIQGERFEETKSRIQARLGVPEKDFVKFRFALMQSHHYKQPSNLTDGQSSVHSRFVKRVLIGYGPFC
jgi:ubiquitin carboxyl-terminal hydrolase 7